MQQVIDWAKKAVACDGSEVHNWMHAISKIQYCLMHMCTKPYCWLQWLSLCFPIGIVCLHRTSPLSCRFLHLEADTFIGFFKETMAHACPGNNTYKYPICTGFPSSVVYENIKRPSPTYAPKPCLIMIKGSIYLLCSAVRCFSSTWYQVPRFHP